MARTKEITEDQVKLCNLAFLLGNIELVKEFLSILEKPVTKRTAYRYVTDIKQINKAKHNLKKQCFAFSFSQGKSLRSIGLDHNIHSQLLYTFLKEIKDD